jgi:hypothetical protein
MFRELLQDNQTIMMTNEGLRTFLHYGRSKLSRVPHTSPSAKNRTFGEANLPRVLHSGKMASPECLKGHDTRGRQALGEGHLPRAQHSGKTGTRKKLHLTAILDGAIYKKK